jgi:hypothetical protein
MNKSSAATVKEIEKIMFVSTRAYLDIYSHVPSLAHVSRSAIKAMASDDVVAISLPLVPESTVVSSNSTGDDGGRLSALLLCDELNMFL